MPTDSLWMVYGIVA